jgi:hypothetical protein
MPNSGPCRAAFTGLGDNRRALEAYDKALGISPDYLLWGGRNTVAALPGGGTGIYAPIVDIAVGPFAITRRYIDEYGELLDQTRAFIERLIGKHNENCEGQEENACFEDIRNFNEKMHGVYYALKSKKVAQGNTVWAI